MRPLRPRPLQRPRLLQPGDAIALAAPASPFCHHHLHQAARRLEELGYRTVFTPHVFHKQGYLAGSDAHRAADLIDAVKSPDIAAIFCARGGYGSSRLLRYLPFRDLAGHCKIFLGFSDITFLHAAFYAHCGWLTFHGPNAACLGEHPHRLDHVIQVLSQPTSFRWTFDRSRVIRDGVATGTLLGGNLTCLSHLAGTAFATPAEGTLLMIEDRGEALYRLDRMLTHLSLTGLLDKISGLLLGQFTECDASERVLDMIRDHVRDHHFPVVAGFDFGHGDRNQVVPLGCPFRLDTYDGSLQAITPAFCS